MVSDGSYMRHKHAGACSGAFVLYCSKTRNKASCSWAELQVKFDSYRGELLGAIGFYLSLAQYSRTKPANLSSGSVMKT